MKKILLPTLLATAVAPAVSIVGCSANPIKKAFELDKFDISGPEFEFYRSGVNLTADTWYEANIDTSAHASQLVGTNEWMFAVGDIISIRNDFSTITKANVWIDGNALHQVSERETILLKPDEFCIQTVDNICVIDGNKGLDGKHTIKIQFQIKKDAKRVDLVYIIAN